MKENWTYGGRVINFLAGLPVSVPAQAIDRVCISSMSAIHQGAMEIMLGYSDIVFACGMEHLTHLPIQMELNPHLGISPSLFKSETVEKYDLTTVMDVCLTAEKLYAKYRDELGWTRKDFDEWGLRSHRLATKALREGYFINGVGYSNNWKEGEIIPVEVKLPDGTNQVLNSDQSIRPDCTLEKIEKLPPSCKTDGAINAANSSPLNSGAVALLLMSKKKMVQYGLEPMAKIVSMGWVGVDPSTMGEGPLYASRKALKHAGLEAKDIDYWEINESYSVVVLLIIKKLGIDSDRVNIKGDALALGHPLGASGGRVTGTLARILRIKEARYGCAAICGGGGQGGAIIIEN
ncbi:MAG: acetyl-CoA C-acyltransferase [Candidatus Jordarchaeum sp.]|uniref:acetyl-CoA C-acyltransferase n=1 Tax=Candidatus Jordarchaeum sp. TaxID=2823881 RepID=UPI004049B592